MKNTWVKIALDYIDREEFRVSQRDGYYLITPQPHKHVWEDGERHLRSLLTDEDGLVLSAGFPKFHNVGEIPEDDAEFFTAIERGEAEFTVKMDGTLIIADQHEDELCLRTRGSHELGQFYDEVVDVIRKKYRQLFTVMPRYNYSLLMEYTGHENPEDRIVIDYPNPNLTVIGAVDKRTLDPVYSWEKLADLAYEVGVPVVRRLGFIDTDREPGEVIDYVRSWENAEGVVASFTKEDGERKFIKLKSDWYVKLHRIRSELHSRKLRIFCWLNEVETLEELQGELYSRGFDYEILSTVEEEFAAYQEEAQEALVTFESLRDTVEHWRKSAPGLGLVRKDFVEWGKENFKEEFFSPLMRLYDGQYDRARRHIIASVLGESPTTLENWAKDKEQAEKDLFKLNREGHVSTLLEEAA